MSTIKRSMPENVDSEHLAKKVKLDKAVEMEENYDFLFDQEDDFDLGAIEAAEKEVNKAKLDLTSWQRCLVKEVEREKKTFALILKVVGLQKNEDGQDAEAKCFLQGPWCHTRVAADDIVSLKAQFDESLNAYKVDKDQGFCVVNPDWLISGTTVVGSLFCRRKSVLQDRFKGIDPNNKVMVIGSLVHELLQIVLEKGILQLKDIEKEAVDLLNTQDTAFMLYSSQLTREDTTLEVMQFVKNIHKFVQQYIDQKENSIPIEKDNFNGRICEIRDIEENLWIPQMGIKGKIDVSVKVESRNKKGLMAKFNDKQEKILPLELKTGRATFSMEHKGQLILYQMMLNALDKPTNSGLLLYLREGFLREIPSTRNEQRDLITLRNEISHYLTNMPDYSNLASDLRLDNGKFIQPFELPEPISHPTACAQCAYASLCCSFAKTDPSLELRTNHPIRKLSEESLKHLTAKDYEYFIKWCHLLTMEEKEARKSNFQRALWCYTPDEREQMGRAICGLHIANDGKAIVKKETRYEHRLVLKSSQNGCTAQKDVEGQDLMLYGFSLGEYIIVSTTKRLAIAAGPITDIDSSSITVSVERNLMQNYSNEVFIIDKYDSHSGNTFNFTNLGILLDDTDKSQRLRQIIVELEQPTFHKVLPKIVATEGAEILKQLNSVQRAAVLKALTTQSFMLIKGLPGTGKTQTLVAIIRLLYLMGKSIIITSHTHSAVDNLLLRLKPHNVPFLRLGNGARVNPQLHETCESTLVANCHTEHELNEFYNSYRIVGVTCLGSSNAIFMHRRFDFCIVDEATQVMQPTVLRPLFFCDRFILVGDPEQLPPLVKSAEARKKGADESLFHRLDSQQATSVLTLQYRMNKTITKLANDLTYNGSLLCASNEIKMANMPLPMSLPNPQEKWLQRVLQTHVDQSVFLLDTQDCSERSSLYAKSKHSTTCALIEKNFNEDSSVARDEVTSKETKTPKRFSKYSNYCEAAIVFHIVKTLLESKYDPDRIGIIAPYRVQVELLRKLALHHQEFYGKQNAQLNFSLVEVNTVDQYQGRDKDIIIYSCSRTGPADSKNSERCRDAEILEDKRRLTVAITRSKHKLIIVGDSDCIQQYTPFQILLQRIPGFCKLKLEDNKMGFHWDSVMDELTKVIHSQSS